MAKARATKARKVRGDEVPRTRRDEDDFDSPEASLQVQLARVRARFGLDPAIPSPALAEPWTSPSGAVEEDEAEFVDAMGDCLSVGLPLNAALASWISGDLARDDEEIEEAEIRPFAELHVPAKHRIVAR